MVQLFTFVPYKIGIMLLCKTKMIVKKTIAKHKHLYQVNIHFPGLNCTVLNSIWHQFRKQFK